MNKYEIMTVDGTLPKWANSRPLAFDAFENEKVTNLFVEEIASAWMHHDINPAVKQAIADNSELKVSVENPLIWRLHIVAHQNQKDQSWVTVTEFVEIHKFGLLTDLVLIYSSAWRQRDYGMTMSQIPMGDIDPKKRGKAIAQHPKLSIMELKKAREWWGGVFHRATSSEFSILSWRNIIIPKAEDGRPTIPSPKIHLTVPHSPIS